MSSSMNRISVLPRSDGHEKSAVIFARDMDKPALAATVPLWRLTMWALLAIGLFGWTAHAMGNRAVFWAGVIGVPIIIGMMLGIVRVARGPWVRQHFGLLIYLSILLKLILAIWDALERGWLK